MEKGFNWITSESSALFCPKASMHSVLDGNTWQKEYSECVIEEAAPSRLEYCVGQFNSAID